MLSNLVGSDSTSMQHEVLASFKNIFEFARLHK